MDEQPAPAAAGQTGDVASRLRAILAVSGAAAAWEWNVAGRRIVGDAGFATLFGISAAAASQGISPSAFLGAMHPADRDRMRLAIGGLIRGSDVLSKQFRVILKDGTVRWLQAKGRAFAPHDKPAGEDKPVLLRGVLVDITEQKRLEEQLRISQTAGGVGTFEHLNGFGTAHVSQQFCAVLGLRAASDLPVRTINAVVEPGYAPLIDLEAQPGDAQTSHVDLCIRRPDNGEVRWVTRRGEYLRDAETSGFRFSGVVYDITEPKRVERQLRELNESLESRVEARTRERDRIWRVSQDLLGVADLDGRWISINPAWLALLGWQAHEIVGRTSEWLEHGEDAATTQRALAQLAGGHKTLKFENRLRTRQGEHRWLSWTAVPEDGLLYCVGRDITAAKAAEAALAHAEDQLRQSQKMEAVGQLTGGLAHDFNNLLTGITGSLELLQARIAQGRLEDFDRYINAAQGASRRAAALTHRLLAFSRRQTLDPKVTDVNLLIAGMDELVRRTMGPQVTVQVMPSDGLWTTLVDPNQLENALLNLCINARDAMPEGGRLVIEGANHRFDAQEAAERDLVAGEYLSLCVTDDGVGMSPEVAARAFDPFFTTKPLGQGTGLGLSMIYGFTRQSGGQARILSKAGAGTTICIYLPRHVGEAEPTADTVAMPAAALHAQAGETVLVVEDEPTIRMLVIEVLTTLGYETIEAADGSAALAVLQSDARIDLLVTDVGLPGGMNGRQVADHGRVARPGLKVLFMTGYAENAVVGNGRLAAGMHVLTKPFAMETLASRIRKLIAEK
jgi:PAS domain S-box-containing protein